MMSGYSFINAGYGGYASRYGIKGTGSFSVLSRYYYIIMI